MTSVKLKLHKNKLLKDGTYPLVFQIIHNRRKKVLYTNYKVRESDFDPVSGKVRADDSRQLSDRSAQRINRALNRERKTLLSKIAFYEEHGIDFCVEDLDDRSSRQHNVHLLQYMNKQIREKILARRNGTAAAYKSTHSSLQKYLGGKDVRASEINPMFVRKYEEFLRKQQVSDNTIAFYMRNLRTIYNNILQDGFPSVGESPFKATRTTVHKTVKRALSKKNMVLLVHCTFSPSEPLLEFARDIFLFSFYTRGMSLVDIVFLRKEHIFDNAIHYVRHKSSQPLRIPITEPLAALIAKYDNDSPYIFPILRDDAPFSHYDQYRSALARINRNLKRVGLKLGLTTPLTTYVARHTWATLAKQCGAPVAVISEGLGHASEKITHIYLKEFDSDVLDRINEIVTRL